MTEEERLKEVERIAEKSRRTVKIPPDQQRIIHIVRYKSGKLTTRTGTLEEVLQTAKQMECLYGPIEHIE